jgi:hypothetical protein
MTLSRKIAAAVDEITAPLEAPREVTVEEGPNRLTLHLSAAGPVGLAFDSLDFATTSRPEWSPEALRAWGGRLTARLTYLMEPLVVLEHDPVDNQVKIRSESPTQRSGRRTYYEVRLHARGTLRLSRVTYDEATRRRQPEPCQLTREALERLADDLVASVA